MSCFIQKYVWLNNDNEDLGNFKFYYINQFSNSREEKPFFEAQ